MRDSAAIERQTIDVRLDEILDLESLEPWLRNNLPHTEGPLTVRQFSGGHANLTYLIRFGTVDYVLRRPPLGPVAASAHDMEREHKILSQLWKGYPLAPRSYAFCDDPNIINAEFHVLECKKGIVIRGDESGRHLSKPSDAKKVSEALVDALADFHLTDAVRLGLGDLGRPEGFLERQVSGWIRRWQAAVADNAPDASSLIEWIGQTRPETSQISLVHNDYKLDNVMFDPDDLGRATAVLDWDMCTRGDPLTDLGTMLNYWLQPGDPYHWRLTTTTPTDFVGFLSREQAIVRYGKRTGFDLSDIRWYRVFSTFRSAVILQQIFKRWLDGQTIDQRFATFGDRIAAMIDKAQTLSQAS